MIRSLVRNPLGWPLTTGVVPFLVLLAGFAAVLALTLDRRSRWRTRLLPSAVLLAAALTALLHVVVSDWWQPFPEGLPRRVTAWIGAGVLGLCLAAFRMPSLRRRGRVLAAVAAALAILMSASQINRQFDQYPTVRVLISSLVNHTPRLATTRVAETVSAPQGGTLADVWHRPADLPAKGTVAGTTIPGLKSGYHPRDAYVYLPPAYQANPRPLLPVLVLMPGQPGSPADWVHTGRLQDTMDGFAAAHQGLAPIVLVVDAGGSAWGNTLCLDSRITKAQTYLAQDVPDWARTHLQTAEGRTSWSIGGLSYGGTCSLQLAVNAPGVYGSFLDISGQEEPTLGSHRKTVDQAFGGDENAFDAVDPLHLMASQTFSGTAAVFVVGASDGEFGPQQRKVHAAALNAGMKATLQTVPGGHDWTTFRAGLAGNLTWLAQQTRLIP